MAKVSSLTIHPVKSCKGISLQTAVVTPSGLAFDRVWMVVTEQHGRFVSQRQKSKMALIEQTLPPEALTAGWSGVSPGASLTLSAPGMPPLCVALYRSAPAPKRTVTVWSWSGQADDEGDDAAAWFSQFLGTPVRLVRFSDDAVRETSANYAAGDTTVFSDGYPFLVISDASLEELNGRLPEPIPMNRFRPNITVSGTLPFAEDTWDEFQVGASDATSPVFRSVKPCSRCKVTTIDQASGEVGQEPLRALGKFRTGGILSWKGLKSPDDTGENAWRNEVFMGWNLTVKLPKAAGGKQEATISVGDPVTIISTRDWAVLTTGGGAGKREAADARGDD